jgi:NAD(P)-dependent dehydrogenase (short-subunit alcohol dehydrogenase family)
VEAFGQLDIAFNNAGVEHFAEIADLPAPDFDDVVATNLRGTYLGVKHQIPALERAGGGSIVNMSSVAGSDVGVATNGAYAATKAGIEGLTRTAALEAAGKGIRVNAVVGASIDTPTARGAWESFGVEPDAIAGLNPVGRLGRPEDVARAVLFLSAAEASYITGTMLHVDGGFAVRGF